MSRPKYRLHFQKLTSTDFEEFCFDLLQEVGFINLDWRKGAGARNSPADSGRDIEASLERVDVDKAKHHEKWFVDCKHFRSSVGVKEFTNLLAWAEAERPDVALFVVSGFLSNAAKDYLKSYQRNNRPTFKIKYWERPTLERFAREPRELFYGYGMLRNALRSEKQVIRAERELTFALRTVNCKITSKRVI